MKCLFNNHFYHNSSQMIRTIPSSFSFLCWQYFWEEHWFLLNALYIPFLLNLFTFTQLSLWTYQGFQRVYISRLTNTSIRFKGRIGCLVLPLNLFKWLSALFQSSKGIIQLLSGHLWQSKVAFGYDSRSRNDPGSGLETSISYRTKRF